MIRVGVNARVLGKPGVEGVIRYTRALLRALAEREADRTGGRSFEYLLFGVDDVPDGLRSAALRCADEPAPAHSGPRAHWWEQTRLPRAAGRYDLDVFHTPAGNPPLLARVPLVTTIHDLSPVVHPEWFPAGYAALYRALTPLAVRRSDRVVCVSRFARDELRGRYPHAHGKTVRVYNGHVPPAEAGADAVGWLATTRFVLAVGAANPRKNLDGLVAAYRRYRDAVADPATLVVVGPIRGAVAEATLEAVDGVEPLGSVSDARLGWLYRHAGAFVYPSLYEGFGLPVLEAMSAGTPVVTADRGATAEVADDAACLVDPTDPVGIARGIERVLDDRAYREDLVAQGRERAASFTWARTARRMADVYRSVAEAARGARTP